MSPARTYRSTRYSVLSWYAAGALAAVVIGFVAARFHLWGLAPVGLLSIVVGCVLGASLGWLATFHGVTCRIRLVVGTIALGVVTALSEHAWLYHDFRRQWHEARAKSAEVALFRPETPWSPVEFFARELTPANAALWLLDAALIVAAAIFASIIVQRYSMENRAANSDANPLNFEP
jgi:hypothetical protein